MHVAVDFPDRLGIEPPVSDALILTMAKLFTLRELSQIMLLHSGLPLAVRHRAHAKAGCACVSTKHAEVTHDMRMSGMLFSTSYFPRGSNLPRKGCTGYIGGGCCW